MSAPRGTGPAGPDGDALDRILTGRAPHFALLHRPDRTGSEVDVLLGTVSQHARLAEIPLPDGPAAAGAGPVHDAVVLVPYRQIAERGLAAADDGAPLLAMTVAEQSRLPLAEVRRRIPDVALTLSRQGFDIDDESYAELVRRVIADEIGTGQGANFVIKRTLEVGLAGVGTAEGAVQAALTLFRRLLTRERGAYWTFAVGVGDRVFVGATPERHVSVRDGAAVMNPISGTYRYPAEGPSMEGLLAFLADAKETDELYMVLDEELKMMARICPDGGRVFGPFVKEMAALAHTEYFIEGRTDRDVRDVLHETLLAPTVTGSPLESAARVIARYEPGGRGYYAGVIGLISREPDATLDRALDSAILIRTAAFDADGTVRIPVGATLVRHSDPDSEVAETRAKAAGLLRALQSDQTPELATHPDVLAALARRNSGIAEFWLKGARGTEGTPAQDPDHQGPTAARRGAAGQRALIIDAEDTFTAMLRRQLDSIGLTSRVARFDEPHELDDVDLVVMGPGPGDPRAATDPKIAALAKRIDTLLTDRVPFLAVCLSHQVLSLRLGLELVRRPVPNQGLQREIDLFGARERVGFYNTYSAVAPADRIDVAGVGAVRISRDRHTGEVDALRGPGFASMQFHAESVLTVDGPRLLAEAVEEVLAR